MNAGRMESLRVRGFRSLADVELSDLCNANALSRRQRLRKVQFHPPLRNDVLDAGLSARPQRLRSAPWGGG